MAALTVDRSGVRPVLHFLCSECLLGPAASNQCDRVRCQSAEAILARHEARYDCGDEIKPRVVIHRPDPITYPVEVLVDGKIEVRHVSIPEDDEEAL